MWRKWYTSRNASAVTFQLHGTMTLRTVIVRSESPASSSSWSSAGPNQSCSGRGVGVLVDEDPPLPDLAADLHEAALVAAQADEVALVGHLDQRARR